MPELPYATDEDVAIRAPADFAILCPRDQKVACGSDGRFDLSDLWTLRSASTDFSARGVVPGQVVQLLGPTATFRPPGESLVVMAASGDSVTLRRKGRASGLGQPPSGPGGLVSVVFTIATLTPQIEEASFALDRRFGISDLIAGRDVLGLLDPRELREATVLTVLHRQYLAMSRDAGGSNQDALASKAGFVKADLDELLARMVLQWRTTGGGAGDGPTSRYSTRIVR